MSRTPHQNPGRSPENNIPLSSIYPLKIESLIRFMSCPRENVRVNAQAILSVDLDLHRSRRKDATDSERSESVRCYTVGYGFANRNQGGESWAGIERAECVPAFGASPGRGGQGRGARE